MFVYLSLICRSCSCRPSISFSSRTIYIEHRSAFMTVERHLAPYHDDHDKIRSRYIINNQLQGKYKLKSQLLLQLTSYIYPILLSLLLIIGTIVLVVIVTREQTCRASHKERTIELSRSLLPFEHVT
jgi:hypothetical protein